MSNLIVVVGATGGQGGSVIKAFLNEPGFKLRGITRNVDSEKAKHLTAQGVEMVRADLKDESSLVKACQGAYAIFAITDYYEHFFPHGKKIAMETEYTYGTNLARAASKVSTLKHYLWSTLPFTSALSQGKAIVPHFEGKGRVDQYIRDSLPDLLQKTTFCIFTIFAENMTSYPIFKPLKLESINKWIQLWPAPPESPYASLGDHRANTGIFVRAIIRNPPATPGTYVKCGVEDLTLDSMLAIWGRASGLAPNPGQTMAVQISVEQYVKMWGEMGEEQASQWIWFKTMEEMGIKTLPGVTMIEGIDLVSEEDKKQLLSTEESLKRLDWSSYEGANARPTQTESHL